jgi:hypothetical protein
MWGSWSGYEIEALGRGQFYGILEKGQVIFSTSLEDGTLDVYIDSFVFEKDRVARRVVFIDVSSISGRLIVELFSNVVARVIWASMFL